MRVEAPEGGGGGGVTSETLITHPRGLRPREATCSPKAVSVQTAAAEESEDPERHPLLRQEAFLTAEPQEVPTCKTRVPLSVRKGCICSLLFPPHVLNNSQPINKKHI